MSAAVDFDPYSHRWQQDPYPLYRELRDASPVHYHAPSETWTVWRYDDVGYVLRHPELFSSNTMQRRPLQREVSKLTQLRLGLRFMRKLRAGPRTLYRSRMLIMEDGDVHSAMREFVNRGFTPRGIGRIEERIREIVGECMARIHARDPFDLVSELNIPLPVRVIAELLGIEPERYDDFKRWSDTMIAGSTGSQVDPMASGIVEVMAEMRAYLRPIVRARRAQPAADLISTLVATAGEGALDDFEVFYFVLLLLVAGNETTTNLLGNAVDALLDHPDELARVSEDPKLIPGLVEEVLRWDSPVQRIGRISTQEVELSGTRIPADALVFVSLGSANRDERRFDDPDRFDVTRDTRGHLAFGLGKHFCLGASLARLEARLALEALVPELPRLARLRPERVFLDSYLLRGRARLELRAAA